MTSTLLMAELEKSAEEKKAKEVKVLVWDLDETLWHGVLLESPKVTLRPGIRETIAELDRRGILQSIASKNDHDHAMAKLHEFGLDEYFLYPQIGWNAKSEGIKNIAASINVGIDTLAFIDDQSFEREEVAFNHSQVLCLDAIELSGLLKRQEFNPRFITEDSRQRRRMYMSDIVRNGLEEEFKGPKDEFLATLGLKLTLAPATEDDLQRAEELTKRTHQLNTTGYTYSYDELRAFMESPNHELLIASLEDKYGTYGKIGLSLVEKSADHWMLKLLLMSCRVMSRGVGTIMLGHLLSNAQAAGVKLQAEFIRTDRNRMMLITYRLGNFQVVHEDGDRLLLEHDCLTVPDFPPFVEVNVAARHSSRYIPSSVTTSHAPEHSP